MLAVIAAPRFAAAAAAWLAALRSAHDPLQDRVAPHVTLAFPQAVEDEPALIARVAAVAAAMPAFGIAFDRLGRMDDPHRPKYRHLNVLLADGPSAARLEPLHRALAGSVEPYAPHLTISRFGAVYCAKALERQIGALGTPLCGRVEALDVLRIESGAVRLSAKFRLAG